MIRSRGAILRWSALPKTAPAIIKSCWSYREPNGQSLATWYWFASIEAPI
jgi:hypothetical protein